jgi:hypothetical protein
MKNLHLLAFFGQVFGNTRCFVIVLLRDDRDPIPGFGLALHDVPPLHHVRQVYTGNIVGHARKRTGRDDDRVR